MKAVKSNRIYMSCTEEQQAELDKELTYVIPSYNPDNPPQVIKNLAQIRPGLVTIPAGRIDLIPDNYELVEKRTMVPVEFPKFEATLREDQQEVYDQIDDSCIINAKPSWGKTFTGLAVAAKLGQKTLIVTHNTKLRTHWVKEIKKVFGITASEIGSGKFSTEGPIVVGNVQSLYKKMPKLRDIFGTVIMDEMHHVPSRTFSVIIDDSKARYKIGLSGTLERKDGKHVVFRDYFGNKIYKPDPANFMTPEVHILKTDVRFMDGGNIPWAKRINNLVYNEDYQHTVALTAAVYAKRGYKVLVVSGRVAFLEKCAELIGDNAVCITGKVDEDQREFFAECIETGDADVLCGTLSIFKEGISINPLSCLILAEPINNEPMLEQLIGRIQRIMPGKPKPVVIDIHWQGKTARRQASNRMGYYMRKGFVIKTI